MHRLTLTDLDPDLTALLDQEAHDPVEPGDAPPAASLRPAASPQTGPSNPRSTASMPSTTPQKSASVCPVCTGHGTLLAPQPTPPHLRVLTTYPAAGVVPAQALVVCPQCQSRRQTRLWPRLDSLWPQAHQREAMAAIAALLARRVGWLTLVGGYGTGKTTLIQACANELGGAPFSTGVDLIDSGMSAIRTGGYDAWLLQRKRAPILVVDELDAVRWVKHDEITWGGEMLLDLLNSRYQRPTLLTLMTCNDLAPIPARLISRIKDRAHWVVRVDGPDLRATDVRPDRERTNDEDL
jgi:hypothetical protein